MPRSPTILTPPPGILPFVPNTTIRSQDANALFNDLYQDGNTPRPIAYGGTGANNAQDALSNLGAVGQSNFLDAYPVGDFYESIRDLGSNWLRRNGGLYDRTAYPELAAIMPPLPDGMIFSRVNYPSTNSYIGAGVGNGIFIATGTEGAIITSPDRKIWTPQENPIVSGVAQDVAYGAGLFVIPVTNGAVHKSPDGEVWSSQTVLSGGLLLCADHDGTNFMVGGRTSGLAARVYWSPEANTWNDSGLNVASAQVNDIASNGTVAIAVLSNGNIYRSTDHGQSWAASTSGVSSALSGVCWDEWNSVFVAVGAGGLVLTSPTGLSGTWTPRASGVSANLLDVTASSNGLVAVGAGGVVLLSTTAFAWTSVPTGFSHQSTAVVADPDNPAEYLIVGIAGNIWNATRTLPTQFRVPDDDPQYGWIKAKND